MSFYFMNGLFLYLVKSPFLVYFDDCISSLSKLLIFLISFELNWFRVAFVKEDEDEYEDECDGADNYSSEIRIWNFSPELLDSSAQELTASLANVIHQLS